MYPAPVRTAIAGSWALVVVAGISTVAPVARMPRAVLDRLSAAAPGRGGHRRGRPGQVRVVRLLRAGGARDLHAAQRPAAGVPVGGAERPGRGGDAGGGRLPGAGDQARPAAGDRRGLAAGRGHLDGVAARGHVDAAHRVAGRGGGPARRVARAMAAAVDPGTGSHPRVSATDTGSFPRVAGGPQPRASAADTGSFPRVAGGPQPRVPPRTPARSRGCRGHRPAPRWFPARTPGPPAGRPPRVAGVRPHTGPQPGLRPARGERARRAPPVNGRSGSLPAVGTGPHTGSLPPVGSVPANGHTGPQPALRPVAGPPARAPQPGLRSVAAAPRPTRRRRTRCRRRTNSRTPGGTTCPDFAASREAGRENASLRRRPRVRAARPDRRGRHRRGRLERGRRAAPARLRRRAGRASAPSRSARTTGPPVRRACSTGSSGRRTRPSTCAATRR